MCSQGGTSRARGGSGACGKSLQGLLARLISLPPRAALEPRGHATRRAACRAPRRRQRARSTCQELAEGTPASPLISSQPSNFKPCRTPKSLLVPPLVPLTFDTNQDPTIPPLSPHSQHTNFSRASQPLTPHSPPHGCASSQLTQERYPLHVSWLRQQVQEVSAEHRQRQLALGTSPSEPTHLPAFTLQGGMGPLVVVHLQGLMTGSPELREEVSAFSLKALQLGCVPRRDRGGCRRDRGGCRQEHEWLLSKVLLRAAFHLSYYSHIVLYNPSPNEYSTRWQVLVSVLHVSYHKKPLP